MVKFKVVPKKTLVSFEYLEKGIRVRKGFSADGGIYAVPKEAANSNLFKYYLTHGIFSLVTEEAKAPEVKHEKVSKTPLFSIHSEESEKVTEPVEAEPTKKRGRKKTEEE